MYAIYCQSCHGPGGRGDGPGAKMLERKPPDLTRLSRDQGGDFPLVRVLATIDGRERVPDHEGQMPIWGLSLQQSDADANQEGEVREKLRQLAEYLRSIQDVD